LASAPHIAHSAETPTTPTRSLHAWLWAVGLAAPMLVTYAVHFAFAPKRSIATGFVQYDQLYYCANAREHFDAGHFEFLYSLPFSPFYDSPRIYAQPFSLLFGWLQHVSAWPPGYLYVGFGVISAVACIRVAMALLEQVLQRSWHSARLLLICFVWGGGLFALAGAMDVGFRGIDIARVRDVLSVLFRFDPVKGYWFLNLGRNLFYSTEAFYHLLALATVLLAMRGRLWLACLSLAIICASHPFTGVQFALIMSAWGVLEFGLQRRRGALGALPAAHVKPVHALAFIAVLAAHVAYYMVVLPAFPEHRALQEQWLDALPTQWVMPRYVEVLAYALVGLAAAWRFRDRERRQAALQDPSVRLLMVWAVVSLALVNHDLVLRPHQPLHFTRGYVWTPLFLLGAPALHGALANPLERGASGILVAALVVSGFCADNAVWFGSIWWQATSGRQALGQYVSPDQQQVLDLLNRPEYRGSLVVGTDGLLGYLVTVYTPLRAWASHSFNTPHYEQRLKQIVEFYQHGRAPSEWRRVPVISIVHRPLAPVVGPMLLEQGFVKVFDNGSYAMHARAKK
jgi:hypothetical protein